MIIVQQPYLLGRLDKQDIEAVAEKLRTLLAQPYELRMKDGVLGTKGRIIPRLTEEGVAEVSVHNSDGLLFLRVRDPRYEIPVWEVPVGAGYYRQQEDELCFTTEANQTYYVSCWPDS